MKIENQEIISKLNNGNNIDNVLKSLSDDNIINLIEYLDHSYHEVGINLVSDDIFDMIKEYAESKKILKSSVGSKVKSNSVKLPYHMGSMRKVKEGDIKALKNWSNKYKGPYLISDKLDGVSALFYKNKLFTRGNGTEGRDISKLIPHINGLKKIKSHDVTVRGEIILSKGNFDELCEKGIVKDSNPRNTTAGTVNAKNPNMEIMNHLDFVAYEVLNPRLSAIEQMEFLKHNNFYTVFHLISDISNGNLKNVLTSRKQNSLYEVDGIIITDSSKNYNINEEGNPEFSFAFKMPTSSAEVEVIDVSWNITKDKLLKPKVIFSPVKLNGVNIKQATGFNAKYIVTNNIGVGAILSITRSGDVIPYIQNVIKDANEPKLPSKYKYKWGSNNVDFELVVNDDKNVISELKMKELLNTIQKLEIEGLKEATVKKLFNNGFHTIKDILEINVEKLNELKIDSFGEKKIKNIVNAIKTTKENLNCIKIMESSNSFGKGFSKKTLKLIYDKFPNFMNDDLHVNDLVQINNVGPTTAENFIKNIDEFKKYLSDNSLEVYCKRKPIKKNNSDKLNSGKFKNFKILFSGGKIKEIEKYVIENGGEIASSISKTVDVLIMKNPDEKTTKQKFAIDHGIEILSPDNFISKYMN